MGTRKIIKFGKNSFVTTLPTDWVKKNRLGKGDEVFIEQNEDKLIISNGYKSEKKEPKTYKINVDDKKLNSIKREIASAYVNNFSTIVLEGRDIPAKAKELKMILHEMVALELLEQDSTKIIARDFLNLKDISITSMVRKMDNLIRTMLTDSKNPDTTDTIASIMLRDQDVNRYYFLLNRAIKNAIQNPSVNHYYNMGSEELLAVWRVVECLEEIANNTKRISRYLKKSKLNGEKRKEILELYGEVEDFYKKIMRSYYTKRREEALTNAGLKRQLMKKCEDFSNKNWELKHVPVIMEKMKNIIDETQFMCRATYRILTL